MPTAGVADAMPGQNGMQDADRDGDAVSVHHHTDAMLSRVAAVSARSCMASLPRASLALSLLKAAAASALMSVRAARLTRGYNLWQIEAAARQQEAVIHEELAEGGDVDVASGAPTAAAPTAAALTADTHSSHGSAIDGDKGGRRSRDMRQTDASRNVQHFAGRISKGSRAHYVAADGHDMCDGGMLHNNRALTNPA